MIRFASLSLVLALAAAAPAQHCYTASTYATPTYTAPAYVPPAIALLLPTFYAANPVVQPAATVAAAPAVAAPAASPCSEIGAKIDRQTEAINNLALAIAGKLAPPVSPPVPLAAPKATQADAVNLDVVAAGARFFQARCAKCHEKSVANKSGGGFVMFDGPQLVDFTPPQRDKILRAIRDGDMPKDGKTTGDDMNLVASWLVATAK